MRIVAKIGTASITTDQGMIDREAIARLVDETATLRAGGHEVIIVSSGAVAAGVAALGMEQRPADMRTVQAVSAVGQSRLVEAYNVEFARHGLVGAQLLVDPFDFVERRQYLHLRAPPSGCSNWAWCRSSTRTTRSRTTSSGTATTTGSPHCSRTAWAPTCSCC